jgi:hypothetical protein
MRDEASYSGGLSSVVTALSGEAKTRSLQTRRARKVRAVHAFMQGVFFRNTALGLGKPPPHKYEREGRRHPLKEVPAIHGAVSTQ